MPVDDPHNLREQLSNQREKLDNLKERDAQLLWDFASAAAAEMAKSTVVQYLSKLRNISENTGKPLAEMTPRDYDRILDEMQNN